MVHDKNVNNLKAFNDRSKNQEKRKLTSISPFITHGNEFSGEIKLLNRARQVNT